MRIVPGGTARPDRVQSPAVLTRFTQLSTIVCIHRGGTTPHLDAALTGDAFFQDPYPVYAALREDSPVHWCEPWAQWVVTCWDDVRDVLLDSDRFSSAGYEAGFVENLETRLGLQLPALRHHFSTEVLSLTDPPVHTRLRRALAGSFTPRVVRSIEPLVNELVRARLDDLRGSARFDVIADLAYPIPAIVIAQLLGVPEHDRDRFCTWSAAIIGFTGGGAPDAERATRAEAAMAEFQSYLADRIARTRAAPGDDLLSLLVTAEPGDRLNDRELVATCITVLFAGHETTANLIGNASSRCCDTLRNSPGCEPTPPSYPWRSKRRCATSHLSSAIDGSPAWTWSSAAGKSAAATRCWRFSARPTATRRRSPTPTSLT